jgi:hypothetical protein
VIVHSHDGKFKAKAVTKDRLVGFPVGREWRSAHDESFVMSKSIRTWCVGVAFHVGILHDVQVDSDTVRGCGVLCRITS